MREIGQQEAHSFGGAADFSLKDTPLEELSDAAVDANLAQHSSTS